MKFVFEAEVKSTVGQFLIAAAKTHHEKAMMNVELAKKFDAQQHESHFKQNEVDYLLALLNTALAQTEEKKAQVDDLEVRIKLEGLKTRIEKSMSVISSKKENTNG